MMKTSSPPTSPLQRPAAVPARASRLARPARAAADGRREQGDRERHEDEILLDRRGSDGRHDHEPGRAHAQPTGQAVPAGSDRSSRRAARERQRSHGVGRDDDQEERDRGPRATVGAKGRIANEAIAGERHRRGERHEQRAAQAAAVAPRCREAVTHPHRDRGAGAAKAEGPARSARRSPRQARRTSRSPTPHAPRAGRARRSRARCRRDPGRRRRAALSAPAGSRERRAHPRVRAARG